MKQLVAISIFSFLGLSCSNKKKKEINYNFKEDNQTLLWEINGDELKEPSYLYGTIHIISEDDFILTDITKKLLSTSDVLVTEVELGDLMAADMSKMTMADGVTLDSLLTEEQYLKVVSLFEKHMGVQKPMFDMMFSKLSPMVIQQQLLVTAFGDKTKSYELEFSKIAKKKKLENVGLETLAFQMEVFGSIPMDDQVAMLVRTIDSMDVALGEFDKLIELYKNQDIEGLASFMNESEHSKELMQNSKAEFLTDRNNRWIATIDSLIQDKQCFIAVGAAHLPEEKGVIELLRKEGYTVKPIENN